MRTLQEVRLECVKMAATLATAKAITPAEIIQKATELFGWVTKLDDAPDHAELHELVRLKERFR